LRDVEKHLHKMTPPASTAEYVAMPLKYPILAVFRDAYRKLTLSQLT
jgi:hypothetical protein